MWTFFDSQHKYILNQMNKSYRSSVAAVNGDIAIIIPVLGLIFFSSRSRQVYSEQL